MSSLRRLAVTLAGTAAAILVAATTAGAAQAKAPCPADMAHVGSSCVDRYEASLVERLADGREVPFSPYLSPKGHDVRAVSKASVVPQAHVSMVEARAACNASGKRLCGAAEWTKACKGPGGTRYPYGATRVAGRCVDTGRTAPLAKLYTPADMFSGKAMNDPRLNQTPNTVAKTGEAEGCTNAYGVHDMVGNVHEWVEGVSGAPEFHGGYYLDTTTNREGCDYATTKHDAVYFDYSTGFRCCADEGALEDAEPTVAPSPAKTPPSIAVPEDSFLGTLLRVVTAFGAGTDRPAGFPVTLIASRPSAHTQG